VLLAILHGITLCLENKIEDDKLSTGTFYFYHWYE